MWKHAYILGDISKHLSDMHYTFNSVIKLQRNNLRSKPLNVKY